MPNMSGAIVRSFSASVSMSTSGSSVASETPDSEHTVSVLDFSYQYAAHLQQQQSIPSSKRKRCQDVNCQEEHQQALCSQRPYDASQCKTSRQSRKVPASGAQPSAQHLATEAGTYYSAVYSCLVQWCCRLKALQPKCIMTPEVLHRAMDLFHRYRSAAQFKDQTPTGAARSAVTPAHLAGCLWIAAKNDGNRSCVPSRTLLTKAIAVQPGDLTRAELEVCCKLRWNIFNSEVASAWQPLRSAYQ